MRHLISEITGRKLDDISVKETYMYSAAWQDEPPLLLQIRNLLVQQIHLTAKVNGMEILPSELIPSRSDAQEYSSEALANEFAVWAMQHNATQHLN